MLTKLLLVLIVFSFNLSFAQENNTMKDLNNQLMESDSVEEKLLILEKLWQQTSYDNEQEAIKYAYSAIALAEESNNMEQLARAHERLGISYSNISKLQKSNHHYTIAIQLHEKYGELRRVGGLMINKGLNFKSFGQLDSALFYIHLSEEYIDLSCCKADSLLYAHFLGTKAGIYLSRGQYHLALKNAATAAELNKHFQNELGYADQLLTIADANESLKNHRTAIDYFKECLSIYMINDDLYFTSETSRKLGVAFSNLIPIEEDSAAFYFKKAIDIAQRIEIRSLEITSLIDYAKFLYKINRLDEAKEALRQSYELATSIMDTFGLSDIALIMGKIHVVEGNYEQAEDQLITAIQLKDRMGLLAGKTDATKSMAEILYQKGHFKEAYDYFIKYKMLSDSLFNLDRAAKFDELQISFDTQQKDTQLALQKEEIKALNAKASFDNLIKTVYGIGMFSFFTISGLIFFVYNQRIKNNKTAREKQEAIYKKEIEFKQKELASQTLHLVQKNTFIQDLKESLERIKSSPDLFKFEMGKLMVLINRESAKDHDWEVFKSYFSEVHNNFDIRIKEIAHDLTENDIRLASFLRMNLSTKEIASILNVMPDSVLKSKYRLKKKLKLDKDDDLAQFLEGL